MIEALEQKGIENEVFVPTYDKNMAVINPNENVTVSECFSKWDRLVFDYKQKKIIHAIEESYDISTFDLIHAYTLFTDGNVARILSIKYKIPYVVAVRNTDINAFMKKRFLLRPRGIDILRGADKIFFLSEAYRKSMFEKYIPANYQLEISKKVEIIPNGIDKFWFQNIYRERDYKEIFYRIEQKSLKLVYVGSIDKNKNIILTCKAIDLLKKDGWNIDFTIAGKIREKYIYNSCKKYVHYLSPLPKEKLIEIYRNADIFVMPSVFETFGLVYAEAMSQGLPVIYTKDQGFDGQFPEGTVGYHVSSTDEKEVAEKIKMIAKYYIDISKHSLNCVEKFNWDKICNLYTMIYKDIIR